MAAPIVGRCNLLWWEVVSWTGSDPSWGSKMIVTAEAEEQTPNCNCFLPLSSGFVPRNPWSAPGHLCPAGHCILGLPGCGSPTLLWPELPGPGEMLGRQ